MAQVETSKDTTPFIATGPSSDRHDTHDSQTDGRPEDRGKAVRLTFLLYGIGVLLPFSVVLSCLDFYALRMPEYPVGNIWPFVINGPQWTTQVLLVVYGANVTHSMRIIPGFSALAMCLVIIPILCNIGGATGFYTVSAMLLILGTASGAA